jgi:hypothetical protein
MKKNLLKMLYQHYEKFNVVYVKVNIGQQNVHIKIIFNLLWINQQINQVNYFLSHFSFIFKFLGENVTTSNNNGPSQGQNTSSGPPGDSTTGKWYSVSARRGGTGTAYPGDRGGSSRGGSYAGGRTGDLRKQGYLAFRSIFLYYLSKCM